MKKRFYNLPPDLQGIVYIILALLCFGAMNSVIRKLSQTLDPLYMTSLRSLGCILIVLPIILLSKAKLPKFNRINIYKGTIDFLSIPIWILAISNMNIPEVVAISFVTPIISALLAIFFLKDYLPIKGWIAMMAGFVGAFIVINPSASGFNEYSWVTLTVCTLWASGNVMTKNLSNKQHPVIIVLYANIIIFALSTPVSLLDARALSLTEVALTALLALLAMVSHFFLAKSYTKAKMSVLLPFDYMRLIFSTMFAFIFFDQGISINTIIGSLVIMGSSIYLANYHRR